ncbi:MAG: hypothetical protein ACXAE3_02790 [Candidatus Kariarchaeaceae archaeon]
MPLRDKDAPKGSLVCRDCGYNSNDESEGLKSFVISEEISEDERSRIEVIEETVEGGGVPQEMIEELREQYREALENFEM